MSGRATWSGWATWRPSNGKTTGAIAPLSFTAGGLYKLRFVNASTAVVHTLRIAGHRFRVTHLDGHGVARPWLADSVTLSPGERIDVEVEAVGRPGSSHAIESGRPRLGIRIPVRYTSGSMAAVASPYRPRPVSARRHTGACA